MDELITKTIAGVDVTLKSGRQYVASRPMAAPGYTKYFPVTIENVDGEIVTTCEWLDYDGANAFINEFNNGAISFDGRIW